MNRFLVLVVFLGGCSTSWDPHQPRTIAAPEGGGTVEVKHGQRLQLSLPAAPQGMEWRLREPAPVVVMAEGAPAADGVRMTPVRSGKETLRLVQLPASGEGEPARTVSYEITVP
jgi:hypothetical protein